MKVYYHDHELFCDTRTKEVFVDKKRVYKMGEPTKEVILNGRKVRLMYMGRRIEVWIDGISFHFRADSPPKQISLTSSQTNQIKRYYVTIDSRTMHMMFNNYKVCTINGGPYGNGPTKMMSQLAPDDYELHEISFVCPPKRIMIDGVPRMMRYDLPVPCIEMENGVYFVIRFSGPPREIYIDDMPFVVAFDKTERIKLNGRAHDLAWGGPGFEVIIDGRPYELQFNKPPREIMVGTKPHHVCIYGEAPDVKICGQLPYELLNLEDNSEPKQQAQRPPPLMDQNFDIHKPAITPNIPTTPANPSGLPDVQELLKKLAAQGLLPPVESAKPKETISKFPIMWGGGGLGSFSKPHEEPVKEKEAPESKVPDLTNFETDLLKQKYPAAISSLYSGIQCATCGNRFIQHETGSSSSTSRYSKHLDWHFRQNKREKDEINKAHSRSWYYSLHEWIQYEELSEGGENGDMTRAGGDLSTMDRESNLAKSNPNIPRCLSESNQTCPATDDIDDSCLICKDPFEIFWNEDKEEWHFKDALRVENRVYHPICYEDTREVRVFHFFYISIF